MLYIKQLVIETTSRCNLRCRGCYRYLGQGVRGQGDMSLEDFKMVVDQFPKTTKIVPFSDGEPLLHPDFGDMLAYLALCGYRYNFATNGTLDRPDVWEIALDTAESICISLDGFRLSTIKYYRGVKTDPRARVNALLSSKRTCAIAVSLARQGQSWGEIEDFIRRWLFAGADYVIIRHWLSSEQLDEGINDAYTCKYWRGYYFVVRSDLKVRLCERNMNSPIIGDLKEESVKTVARRLGPHEICDTCGQKYCGDGWYGQLHFKGDDSHTYYVKKDYFNTIYSLKDVREGVSWE